MSVRYVLNLLLLGGLLNIPVQAQSVVDTLHTIDEVTVKANRTPLSVASAQPVQTLGHEHLEALGIQSVADAVKRLLADRELRLRLGAEGQRFVTEHFDWRLMGDILEEEYDFGVSKARG